MVSLSETEAVEMDGVGATSIECGCCYWEYQVENMVQCRNGHLFCFKCIRKRIDEIIYGGLKAHASLSCMAIDCCEESIPLSEISRALPNDVIERYEYRQAQEAIVEAKIEGLVYCPFCNIPYEVDKCVQVLDCQNPKCLKASCIKCKKLSHLALRCEEVEEKSETALRREVEERMTKAVIRECNICKAELIKAYGCNRVTCMCGNTMCYVCKRAISYSDMLHFCGCLLYSGEPGKPCQICNRCSLVENEIEDNEALAAREEALTELVDNKSESLHLVIGPPLKRRTRQPPTEEQHFPPPEFNELGDQLTNMVVPPQLRPSQF
jgi:TRIAD3 protein (E3 ubiquitin-protein ligase RNF216)